jgi:hypothetical protein
MAAHSATPMSRHRGDPAARFAVRAAVAAPSVHNTQPWSFASAQGVIRLSADQRRGLPRADPAGREMAISCGAALFNLRLAVRHLGFAAGVRLLPDPSRPGLLAEIRWGWYAPPAPDEEQLYRSIERRHTHRGPFTAELPPLLTGDLRRAVRAEGAELHIICDPGQQHRLAGLIRAAELTQRASPGFAAELARWAPPPGVPRPDGVPATAYPKQPDGLEFATRDFGCGSGRGFPPPSRRGNPHALGTVALLTTRDDQRLSWLLAGQALQRLLLHATARGVSAAFHTQPLELAALRDRIRIELTSRAYPQMLLRLGRDGPTAAAPRRPVTGVLTEER